MVKRGYQNAVCRLACVLGSCCRRVMDPEVGVPPVPVEGALYFYGSISREQAEGILFAKGCQDGMYLLRESNSDYVLSLCFQKSVLHYRIRKLSSGEVGLCGVPRQRFAGPVELVQGVEGLATRPVVPCNKSPTHHILPPTHWGVQPHTLADHLKKKAQEWGIDEDKVDVREDLKLLMSKTLHEVQPWFHGHLSRIQAEQSIHDSGHKDGKFLVRERDDSSYALCLSHSGRIKHYKIDVLPSGEFAIQDGQTFPTIMALVSHYTLFSDGLWCSLQDPCVVPPPRSNDTISQSKSRTSDNSLDNRTNSGGGGGTLERNKSSTLRHNSNDNGSPPSKTSRFLNSLNQRKLFSKLFSTVAPQFSQTLPQGMSNSNPSTSQRRARLYPSLSDDNLEGGDLSRSVRARISPDLIGHHPSTPPTCSRKSSFTSMVNDVSFKEGKKGNIQKASSFDFLPAFLSLFIYGDGSATTDRRVKKGTPEMCHRKVKIDRDKPNCEVVRSLSKMVSDEAQKHSTIPVPAPRLSLAKKLCKRNGPVYANREALWTTGRSISLGESTTNQSMEESMIENGMSILQPFSRSASSPSVVSQSKVKGPPFVSTRLSTSDGGSCEPIFSCITVVGDDERTVSLNGTVSSLQPVPKPRLKIPVQDDGTETSCDSCASVDSSTSPTLTEGSEFGQDFSGDIFPSDLTSDEPDLWQDSTMHIEPESCKVNLFVDAVHEDIANGLIPEEFKDLFPEVKKPVSNGCTIEVNDSSIYATLSGSSNVLCLLSNNIPSPPPSIYANDCKEGILIDLDASDEIPLSREESELAYLTLRECRRGPLNLDHKNIELKEKIGTGIFCDVFRGVFYSGRIEVQFAIKMLKTSSVPNPKSEILKEAQTMVALDHPHIVRLIGVSESNSFMLVTELAPLGPLNKYLRLHSDIKMSEILGLMLQVSSAMEYLESRQFVHRDLAARNVLLVNESFIKISDFGMSRAMGLGKEYYRAERAGKWPLKWYAPECIYYFRFSSRSDIWSFGVTLWEVASYGDRPYKGMIGQDILKMFERNERLAKPEKCPDAAYSLMRKCWRYKADDRPSFPEVSEMLRRCIASV